MNAPLTFRTSFSSPATICPANQDTEHWTKANLFAVPVPKDDVGFLAMLAGDEGRDVLIQSSLPPIKTFQ